MPSLVDIACRCTVQCDYASVTTKGFTGLVVSGKATVSSPGVAVKMTVVPGINNGGSLTTTAAAMPQSPMPVAGQSQVPSVSGLVVQYWVQTDELTPRTTIPGLEANDVTIDSDIVQGYGNVYGVSNIPAVTSDGMHLIVNVPSAVVSAKMSVSDLNAHLYVVLPTAVTCKATVPNADPILVKKFGASKPPGQYSINIVSKYPAGNFFYDPEQYPDWPLSVIPCVVAASPEDPALVDCRASIPSVTAWGLAFKPLADTVSGSMSATGAAAMKMSVVADTVDGHAEIYGDLYNEPLDPTPVSCSLKISGGVDFDPILGRFLDIDDNASPTPFVLINCSGTVTASSSVPNVQNPVRRRMPANPVVCSANIPSADVSLKMKFGGSVNGVLSGPASAGMIMAIVPDPVNISSRCTACEVQVFIEHGVPA